MGKCKFANNCKLYDKTSITCNKEDGYYYAPGRYAGCGRDLAELGVKSKWYKKSGKPVSLSTKIKKIFSSNVFE